MVKELRELTGRVDFQVDHTHTPLSLLLRLFFLPEKGRNILLCGFQFEQFLFSFLVLLVELRLFGCQLRILGFQLFRAGQLCNVVCLEIGCCRPVRCQLCTVLLLKCCGSLGSLYLRFASRQAVANEKSPHSSVLSR